MTGRKTCDFCCSGFGQWSVEVLGHNPLPPPSGLEIHQQLPVYEPTPLAALCAISSSARALGSLSVGRPRAKQVRQSASGSFSQASCCNCFNLVVGNRTPNYTVGKALSHTYLWIGNSARTTKVSFTSADAVWKIKMLKMRYQIVRGWLFKKQKQMKSGFDRFCIAWRMRSPMYQESCSAVSGEEATYCFSDRENESLPLCLTAKWQIFTWVLLPKETKGWRKLFLRIREG